MVDDPRIHPMELARPAIYALERANSGYSAERMTMEVTRPDGRRSSEVWNGWPSNPADIPDLCREPCYFARSLEQPQTSASHG